MTLFENLMHCKSQCRHLLRQYLTVKYLERTATCALQRPLVGQRNYSAPSSKKATKSSEQRKLQKQIFFNKYFGKDIDFSKIRFNRRLENTPLPKLKEAIEVLESEEVKKKDIHDNLHVLAISPAEILQRSRCLKEIGFEADVAEIVKYYFLMAMSTETLHQFGALPRTVNPFENIMKNMECSPQLKTEIDTTCADSYRWPLGQLREKIIKCIVAHHLGFIKEDTPTIQYILSKQPASDFHKLVLIYEELGISSKIVKNYLTLLKKSPEVIEQIMEIAEEYKLDLKYIVSRNAGILKKKPSMLALTCRVLFDYGISPAQLMDFPKVFVLDLNNISNTLENMSKWPEFPLLKMQTKFVKLIVLFKRANLHKEYLEKAGYSHCNMNMLTDIDERFKFRLHRYRYINSGEEIATYISGILEIPRSDVIAGLRNHPWFQNGSVNNIKEVLSYLLQTGFTKTQIVNGIALVLYPKAKVVEAYKALPNLNIVQPYSEWKKNINLLHLVLYFVEKGEGSFLKIEPDKSSDNLGVMGEHSFLKLEPDMASKHLGDTGEHSFLKLEPDKASNHLRDT